MGAKRKQTIESKQNEGAQMSNGLLVESDRAMVVMELWWRFRVIGADGVQVGFYCETETECAHESPSLSSTNPCAVRIMFQVTQIVRFLLERGLRFS